MDDDIPYLLLTPGPLSTSRGVRGAMQRDLSTWDPEYHAVVRSVRSRLTGLAVSDPAAREEYTTVLMQGSGTFAVESTLGSVVPAHGKVLILCNGAYGLRMARIADCLRLPHTDLQQPETEPIDPRQVRAALAADPEITHVGMIHCETTTGILNDAGAVGALVAEFGKVFVLDAMSSFGGIPIDLAEAGVHFAVSSANKCIQGVPGFGFIVADRERLQATAGWARSLSLDLHAQWRHMEDEGGKWRFTSPTHAVLAFAQALDELAAEGGVAGRNRRYLDNQRTLVEGMNRLGFRTLLPAGVQSPVITTFLCPTDPRFSFQGLYQRLKSRRFLIYPGKITQTETFRIGSIGHVFPADIEQLLTAIEEVRDEMGFAP